ncbi:MAG: D-alanyl-D-alanine carboxypeptidase [Alphaproteobacteria bacterium]|nr:D-alanyl-D-alanine carboxypeptidase [Alphaproteobacteria bacterium]
MIPFSRLAALAALALTLALPARAADGIETPASHAILVDYESGAVLFSKRGEEQMPPASMSKLMTAAIVFDKLKAGDLTMDTVFTVSEDAWGRGSNEESNMFVKLGDQVRVEDLLRGMIIQSGNDACKVLAEGISGSEARFADLMNETAERIGLQGSHFTNSTGLPDPEHYMTPHDLARLSSYIIKNFPEYYSLYAEKTFEWNGINQANRNPLLYTFAGADGLKTGHTSVSGYGLTSSAVRDGRRLILVVNGLSSEKERSTESSRLLDLGFREYRPYVLVTPDKPVGEAKLWNGTQRSVPLVAAQEISVMMRRESRRGLKVTYAYNGPVKAPVAAGQTIGQLTVSVPDQPDRTFPLYAATAVPEADMVSRMIDTTAYLMWQSGQASAAAE